MTSQKDQIQALITDIDGVLQKTTPRLPWVVSGEITQQRQVLERVRNYLVAFQRRQIASEGFGQAGARPDLLAHDIYYQPAQQYASSPEELSAGQSLYGQDELNAQQMLQAIVQEMGFLRSNLMQPLQADVESLRQQREALVHEIRQLEAQRQGYAGQGYIGQLPGQQQLITEFLQALMSRLQETLPQQVAQTLRNNNQQALPSGNPYANDLALAGSAPSVIAASDAQSQGLGNIQVPQSSSDELLIRLDSTLSIVFESLQRNVQAYQESLSQGLDKMHSMGQQGEMMFTALISHLAQQLGRETSSYLQPAAPTGQESVQSSTPALDLSPSPPVPTQPPIPTVNPALFSKPGAETTSSLPLSLPFPGTEIADRFASAASTNVPEPSVDTAIDSWLRSAASTTPDVDLELAALNLEGFDLSQLAAQDVNALLELDATLLDTNLPSQPILSPTVPLETLSAPADATTAEDTADIDAALKLLEQLSSELQEQPSPVADADTQIDQMLSSPTAVAGDVSTVGIPDDARDELDEFYESLFGADAIAVPTQDSPTEAVATAGEAAPQPTIAPADQPVGEPEAIATSDQPVQPISTLPAETQMPGGGLAEATDAAVTASTAADPTLGWHLPTTPLVTPITEPPITEPEIPAALLEDELLDGWDLADAEMDLSEPPPAPPTDDLLGGWDLTPVDDRTSLPVDPPLATDALSATDDLAALFDDRPAVSAASSDPALQLDAAPGNHQNELTQDVSSQDEASDDEISSLTDLFAEPAFGDSAMPASESLLASTLADTPASPTVPDPTLVNLPTSRTELSSDASAAQVPPTDVPPTAIAPTNLVDGYLTDDRYAPASPDEDLLPLDEPIEPLDSELWLDETTLNRLSEDLFNLEESIGEPAILIGEPSLPDNSESDHSTQSLFADSAFADSATNPESTLTSEPTTLDDWSDSSLDDFATNLDDFVSDAITPDDVATDEMAALLPTTPPVLFPLESESREIAADPPNTVILEGMDDLFANTPIAPPVNPIPPPVPPTAGSPVPFTLEGMDDLFADSLSIDQSAATAPAPAAEPLFTLEGVNELLADDPTSSISLPSAPAPAAEPLFTLEGVDELFADDPTSLMSLPSAPAPAAEPLFTLEGVDELLADDPPTSPVSLPSAPAPAAELPLPFTLEGVDELFADTPVTATPPILDDSPAILPVADSFVAEPEATFSFGEASTTAPTELNPVSAFTLEQEGNLLMEVSAAEASAHDNVSATIAPTPNPMPGDAGVAAPFVLEQVGDLFIEVPSVESTLSEQPVASTLPLEQSFEPSPAPFNLDQVGDLFLETLSEPTPAAPSEALSPTQQPPTTSEPSALEQAFASLIGTFDEPLDAAPSLLDPTDPTTDNPEKKKEMS